MNRAKQLAQAAMLGLLTLVLPAYGQKVDAYITDMGEALAPYGTLTAPNCHSIEIHLNGPWGNFAIPDGQDEHGELTWSIIKMDVHQIDLDLSELDEDRIMNHAIFSLRYLTQHQKGTQLIADTPTVMFSTNGLNNYMTVQIIDPDKVNALALKGQTVVTDSQMGAMLDQRRGASIVFSDQQHADAFQKAIQKAIVLCKAQ